MAKGLGGIGMLLIDVIGVSVVHQLIETIINSLPVP